mmetsp:Transcript_208/g.398  ORF Transcript_208/g.398 Transcript_208/m.398 type:complete len:80 (-) Transcript_208:153-392(-)
MDSQTLIAALRKNGVPPIDVNASMALLKGGMYCYHCGCPLKNIPTVKAHIAGPGADGKCAQKNKTTSNNETSVSGDRKS